jgi:hypothetical protein
MRWRAWRGERSSVEPVTQEPPAERHSAAAAPERAQASSIEGPRLEPSRAGAATYARPGERAAPPEPRRRGLAWRTRDLGAAAVGRLGSGVVLLARLVMTVAVLIALLIGLAIVLRDVDANPRNTIVKGIHEGANFFAGSFTGLIAFKGHPKRAITVDWGIALIAYLIVGAAIAGFIARVGRGGLRFERSRRAASSH